MSRNRTPIPPERLLHSLRRKMAEQNSDLVNKAGVDPLVLADLLIEQALALALHIAPPGFVAGILRDHAARVDQLGASDREGPSA